MPEESPTILETWSVPDLQAGATLEIVARAGEATVIVGANGSGKSALGWRLEREGRGQVHRLLGHRKLWFDSPGPAMTASDRPNVIQSLRTYGSSAQSRYLDQGSASRTNLVLFDLFARVSAENAELAKMYYAKVERGDIDKALGQPMLKRLNSLLRRSGLSIEVDITAESTFEARHLLRRASYPITEMSDGEKSALLLAAEILTGPASTTFIIDEPERHLHRSISPGLIEAIIAERSDCHFVVLTHDLDLAAALSDATTRKYVLTDCQWSGSSAVGWDLHEVLPEAAVPEEARRAVLGGRTQLLFIEGKSQSLDLALYRILYPEATLSPAGGSEEVRRAVAGITSSEQHHWLEAFGIVDNDARLPQEVADLKSKGILVLPVSEVESIYYSTGLLKEIAALQSKTLDLDRDALFADALQCALAALRTTGTPERLAASVAQKMMRRVALAALPDRDAISAQGASVSVVIPSEFQATLTHLHGLIEAADWDSIVQEFPIRDSSARSRVADVLRFKNFQDYEKAVRSVLRDNMDIAAALRSRIGSLPAT